MRIWIALSVRERAQLGKCPRARACGHTHASVCVHTHNASVCVCCVRVCVGLSVGYGCLCFALVAREGQAGDFEFSRVPSCGRTDNIYIYI